MEIVTMSKKEHEPQAGRGSTSRETGSELQVLQGGRSSSRPLHGSAVVDALEERTARTNLKTARMGLIAAGVGILLALNSQFGFNSHDDANKVQEAPTMVVNNYYYNVVRPNMFNAYAKEEFGK
ncbi:hypothetical protein [Streptomyces sp. NPDC001286]